MGLGIGGFPNFHDLEHSRSRIFARL